jgi:hypothetical protein
MSEVKFYYKGKYLGSCDSDYMDCDGLYDLIMTDDRAASEILDYLNSLGDPVFPVSDEDWGTPETNIDNVDRTDLYNTFMKDLGYQYDDWGEVYIDGNFEIFTDDVELESCGRKKKSKKKVLNQKCGSKRKATKEGLDVDMWYGDEFVPGKYGADAFFNDMSGIYTGNIYDENGKRIGDYSCDDSVEIEDNFQIAWNESYKRESFDDDWTVSETSQFYGGERHTLRKYTRDLDGHKILVYPKYNERLDQIDWTVFLDGEKKEVFETSYDAIDFVDYEAADLYL